MSDPIQATLMAARFHARCLERVDALEQAIRDMDTTPRLTAPWGHFVRGLREHFAQEEAVVFPAIRALARGQAPPDEGFAGPLHDLSFELDELRSISDALAAAAPEAGPHEEALLTLLDELEEHARREEQELFPMAMELLARWEAGEASAPGPEERQQQVAEDRSWSFPLDPGHHRQGHALAPGLRGLEDLLAQRRGMPVSLLELDEGVDTLPGRLEACLRRERWPLLYLDLRRSVEVGALRAALDAEISEALLRVDAPLEGAEAAEAARREALTLLREGGRRVSLLLRVAPDTSDASLAAAWRLALENDHVRELLVIGPEAPGALAERLCGATLSLDAVEARRLNRVMGALRAAFGVEREVFVLHDLLLRAERGGLVPIAHRMDLEALDAAAERYATRAARHPQLARARLLKTLVEQAREPGLARALIEGVRLQLLFRMGSARRAGFFVVDYARQG